MVYNLITTPLEEMLKWLKVDNTCNLNDKGILLVDNLITFENNKNTWLTLLK